MYIKIFVKAGAKKEQIEKITDESFKISVKEKAQRNAANRRAVEIVARQFSVRAGDIVIVKGHRSSDKLLNVPITGNSLKANNNLKNEDQYKSQKH